MRTLRRPSSSKALLLGGTVDDGFWVPPSLFGEGTNEEKIENEYANYVSSAYKSNGIVFACSTARLLPFTEARFQYQELRGGRPGRLFGNESLSLLENPWPNGTTGELLARMEQDATLGGNFYATVVGEGRNRRIRRMRPDWVTIVSGVIGDPEAKPSDLESVVTGYIYHAPKSEPVLLSVDRVVHYSPIPDPDAQWRGMSWLTPIMREIQSDTAATKHKAKFFTNGATPPFVIKYDPTISPDNVRAYAELFRQQHTGSNNAYKVLHLGGGADTTTVGTDLRQLDYKGVTAAGETRIAAAAGVGAIIARLSEGLQGSSLNQGNYHAAKRQFADMTLRPLWRTAAASLSKFASPPLGSRLWTDVRDVAFLAEDSKDLAEILSLSASTINALVSAGYEPDAVVDAVDAGDLSRLTGKHSGLYSVQLQSAGSTPNTPDGGAT